jgi:hypothetical protein
MEEKRWQPATLVFYSSFIIHNSSLFFGATGDGVHALKRRRVASTALQEDGRSRLRPYGNHLQPRHAGATQRDERSVAATHH